MALSTKSSTAARLAPALAATSGVAFTEDVADPLPAPEIRDELREA